jgi:pimeloyl-ACP methyl ester carboxylesterase
MTSGSKSSVVRIFEPSGVTRDRILASQHQRIKGLAPRLSHCRWESRPRLRSRGDGALWSGKLRTANPLTIAESIGWQVRADDASSRMEVEAVKTHFVELPAGRIACHESPGAGPAVVLIHGNSSSAKAFSRQIDGPLGTRLRLIGVDLPGHGESADAADRCVYSLPGYARALTSVAETLGLGGAMFVGGSLGGHILLEAAPDLASARGVMIFGTPPLAYPPAMDKAFLPGPAMDVGFSVEATREQAEAFVASLFAPGFKDVPTFFYDDFVRTDGRARAQLAAGIAPGGYRDEMAVVAGLKTPLAIVQGAKDQLVNKAYFAGLKAPTLWRGAVQTLAAGHSVQWETPREFDALVEAFIAETR